MLFCMKIDALLNSKKFRKKILKICFFTSVAIPQFQTLKTSALDRTTIAWNRFITLYRLLLHIRSPEDGASTTAGNYRPLQQFGGKKTR